MTLVLDGFVSLDSSECLGKQSHRFVQLYEFGVGANVPSCQRKGPFSVNKPLKELQPGPPLSLVDIVSSVYDMFPGWIYQITTSSPA